MKTNKFFVSILVVLSILLGIVSGFYLGVTTTNPKSQSVPLKKQLGAIAGSIDKDLVLSNDLSIHFLELGNKYTGDCIFIKAGDNDILVDAGSRTNSVKTIKNYVDQYCVDNTLEYVIATHADQDHISGFSSTKSEQGIFEYYNCKTIIDFPLTNKTSNTYKNYVKYRDLEVQNGAKHYSALQCFNNQDGGQNVYQLTDDIQLEILYNYYYENASKDENEFSVCFVISKTVNGEVKRFLFTGDLEGDGEKRFKNYYASSPIFENGVELFKSNHHGSKTSNTTEFFELIQPKTVVVTCVAGSTEYTDTPKNTFPTQAFINNVAPFTSEVYVTTKASTNDAGYESLNGTIVYCYGSQKTIYCSNDSSKLKDSSWFVDSVANSMRDMPTAWAS